MDSVMYQQRATALWLSLYVIFGSRAYVSVIFFHSKLASESNWEVGVIARAFLQGSIGKVLPEMSVK